MRAESSLFWIIRVLTGEAMMKQVELKEQDNKSSDRRGNDGTSGVEGQDNKTSDSRGNDETRGVEGTG